MRSIIKRVIVIVFYAVLAAVGVNMFLAPSNIFSGGVTGLSQLLSIVGLDFFNINKYICMGINHKFTFSCFIMA